MSPKILVLLFPLLASCSTKTPVVQIIVPAHYVGPITVFFDQPNGTDVDQKDGVTTFRFSNSGTSRIKQSLDDVPSSYETQSFDDAGHPLSTGGFLHDSPKLSSRDKANRMAYFASAINNNDLIGFVGTQNEVEACDAEQKKRKSNDD